uniref:Uncharacterized protein n=1 Tax=Helianthus annuus TaxID=4232 RepID=A0A251SPH8_HELAN
MNDPNGSSFPINTHSPLHFIHTLILNSLIKAICTCLLVYGWDKLYKFAQVLHVIGWFLLASNRSLASLDA